MVGPLPRSVPLMYEDLAPYAHLHLQHPLPHYGYSPAYPLSQEYVFQQHYQPVVSWEQSPTARPTPHLTLRW